MTVIHSTRDQQRDADWAEYEASYEAAYQEALIEHICFCTCGCRQPDTIGRHPLTGSVVPGRCDACRQGPKHEHDVIRPPVETFDWARYEPPVPPRQPRKVVENVGEGDLKEQLKEALADAKADLRAALRTARGERRAAKQLDLNDIHVPEAVTDGSYAVRDDDGGYVRIDINRPTRGPLVGFVKVELHFGSGIVQHGRQYPRPYRPKAGYRQTYRGAFAHLVARLVANPEQARADYEQAIEVA